MDHNTTVFRKPLDMRIEEFWSWFANANLEVGSKKATKLLTRRLWRLDKHLVWGTEVGRDGAPNLLEISPDGIDDFADLAKKVVAAAPNVKGWQIVVFRQPTEGFSIELPSGKLGPEDCKIVLYRLRNGTKAFRLFMPDNIPSKLRSRLAFLILGHTLGEEVVLKYCVLPTLPVKDAPEGSKTLSEMSEYLCSVVNRSN